MFRPEIFQLLAPGGVVAVSVISLGIQINLYIRIHFIEFLCHGIYHSHITACQVLLLGSVPVSHIGMVNAVPRPGHNVDLAAHIGIQGHVKRILCLFLSVVGIPSVSIVLTAVSAFLAAGALSGAVARRLIISVISASGKHSHSHRHCQQQSQNLLYFHKYPPFLLKTGLCPAICLICRALLGK